MFKFFFFLIIILSIISSGIFSDAAVKSELDVTGNFYNRLQFDGETLDFSILSTVSYSGLEWIEPALFMRAMAIGRIQLKGLVREFHNPDGNSPSASVLSESGSLRVTDSMSRSSRYGVLIFPFENYDLSAWLYRSNSGILSAGLTFKQSDIFLISDFTMDGEVFVSACSFEENTGTRLFSSKIMLPRQSGLSTAAELRFLPVGKAEGRRGLIPSKDEFEGNLSIAVSGSLPRYTSPGFMLRAVSFLGIKKLYLNGFYQLVSKNYISSSGEQPDYRVTAGCGFHGSASFENFGFSGKIDCFLKQKMPDILPSRFFEQTGTVNSSLEFYAGNFLLKLKGCFSSAYESCGSENTKSSVDACLKYDTDLVTLDTGYGLVFESIYNTKIRQSADINAGVLFSLGSLRPEFRCRYEDGDLLFKIGSVFAIEAYEVYGSIEVENTVVTGLTIGFET